jgi:putative ABC transport system permease protein
LIGPHNTVTFTIEDQASLDTNLPSAQVSSVSPDYFSVLNTPLLNGRLFADSDDRNAPNIVLIDDAFARRYFADRDPLGRRIKRGPRGSNAPWTTIVGVVGNIKTDGFDKADQPHLYYPILQNPGYAMAVYLRTDQNPTSLTQSLREQVRAVDPNLPIFGERTMENVVSDSLAQRKFAMQVVGLFGLLAMLLTGIGIYGVTAYSVSQRTREIGIRVALGASNGAILRWVITQGMTLIVVGVAVGLVGAFVLTRLLRSLLFGVAATDMVTYVGLATLLAAVALLACYIPARRATKVDPLVALRYE